jgi:hypothetical protein
MTEPAFATRLVRRTAMANVDALAVGVSSDKARFTVNLQFVTFMVVFRENVPVISSAAGLKVVDETITKMGHVTALLIVSRRAEFAEKLHDVIETVICPAEQLKVLRVTVTVTADATETEVIVRDVRVPISG